MKINVEEVQHIAKLAKLRFTNEEAEKMAKEFDSILGHFQSMEEVPLEDTKTSSKEEIKTVLRKDEAVIFEDKAKLFRNVKQMRDGYIQVPKIIE